MINHWQAVVPVPRRLQHQACFNDSFVHVCICLVQGVYCTAGPNLSLHRVRHTPFSAAVEVLGSDRCAAAACLASSRYQLLSALRSRPHSADPAGCLWGFGTA